MLSPGSPTFIRIGAKILPPGPTPLQNSRKYPSPGSDPPLWKSSLHTPSTVPVAVHLHAHPARKIYLLNEAHSLCIMEPAQISSNNLLRSQRYTTPLPTPGILHQIDVASPDQSPHPKVSPLCGSIGRLQHIHGRPLLRPAPAMEAPQLSIQMSS